MVIFGVLNSITRGQGAHPVLLLHGFLGSGRNLHRLANAWLELTPNLKIIMPDHLGHGRSPELPEKASIEDLANAVWSLVDQLGITSALPIVGHSMGGRVALVARRIRPKQVASVHLLDISPGALPHPNATSPIIDALCSAPATTDNRQQMVDILTASGISRAIAEWLCMSGTSNRHGFSWHINRQALRQMRTTFAENDLWSDIEPARETTLIKAANSNFVTDKDISHLNDLGVRTSVVRAAGHFLHAEYPDEVARLLAQYMEEI